MFPHLIFHPTVLPHQQQGLMWFPWLQHSTGVTALLEATEEN